MSVHPLDSRDVVVRTTPEAAYPSDVGGFAPGESYPELPTVGAAPRPNHVFAAVRRCLADAGLDGTNFGGVEWNPFSDLVKKGGKVFILCNFCYDRRPQESRAAFLSKCTHASVLRPILEYVCKAVGPSGVILLGNAPIQSASWDALLEQTGTAALIQHFAGRKDAPIIRAVDLRSWILNRGIRGLRDAGEERTSPSVTIDLATDSLLEGAQGNRSYRVLQYDPARTSRYHRDKSHMYVLSREVLDANLVISVPKLKTHQKVGVTCALKGLVGTVPDKDCLAHHRRGLPEEGGDEFPSRHLVTSLASNIGEIAWGRQLGVFTRLARIAERYAGSLARRMGLITYGGWYGNDTSWRMALDIGRCLRFADSSGRMHDTQQRPHVVLIDGVVGGEGEGPLVPSPAPSRCVLFARDPFAADVAAALAMGFDPRFIKLLRGAEGVAPYPVTDLRIEDVRIGLDGGEPLPSRHFPPRLGRPFRAPKGWRGAIERGAGAAQFDGDLKEETTVPLPSK